MNENKSKSRWAAASLAVCLILLILAGIGFHAFSGDSGSTPEPTKAVCRDITTKSIAYSKAMDDSEPSLTTDSIQGFEIMQAEPTPEDVENLQTTKLYNGWFYDNKPEGVFYACRWEDEPDTFRSFIEKFDGETCLWSVEISDFWVSDCCVVSDGVIVYGETDPLLNANVTYAWMSKLDENGNILWTHRLENGFTDESIAAILEHDDGSYGVISRGDLKYFCLSQFTADGRKTHYRKTEVGNCGFWDAARFGDSYIVQFGSFLEEAFATIALVDHEGSITQIISYSNADTDYYLTDMIEYNGKIYLSAYAVPKLAEGERSYGGRNEIAPILDHLYGNNLREISSEELTPMVRDRYTAILLVCNPGTMTPQQFYAVEGSLGGELTVEDGETLVWNVASITTTFYSPGTSSFTIGGTCYIFRHSFDSDGTWVGLEKTSQITDYRQ